MHSLRAYWPITCNLINQGAVLTKVYGKIISAVDTAGNAYADAQLDVTVLKPF